MSLFDLLKYYYQYLNFGKNNNFHRDSQGYNSRFNNNGFNGENGFRCNNKKTDNKFDNKKNQNVRRDFTRNSNNQIDESEFIEEKNQRDYSSKFIDKQIVILRKRKNQIRAEDL